MKKIYVLDTNVLLSNPNSIYSFKGNDIIIPFVVLEELDKKKTIIDSSVGINARQIIKILDGIGKNGSYTSGAKIGDKLGKIYIKEATINTLPDNFTFTGSDINDNRIISVAYNEKVNGKKVVLCSNDFNVRIKANSLGIDTESYDSDQIVESRDQLYTGYRDIVVEDDVINGFYQGEKILLNEKEHKLFPNEFVMLKAESNHKKTALSQFVDYKSPLKKIYEFKNGVWGLKSRNREQTLAFNLLMDPKIQLVTLTGFAGTGKSLISLASGIEQTLGKDPLSDSNSRYKRFIVIRPITPLGNDIGYLPGSISEKLEPWLAPINDNLKTLFANDKITIQDYINKGIIEVQAMTYIRGRSIPDAFILLDEGQSLSNHEMKSIITRLGERSKLVITGDLTQQDNPKLNELTSGLTNVIEKFKNQKIAGHVTLVNGERSELATIASEIL